MSDITPVAEGERGRGVEGKPNIMTIVRHVGYFDNVHLQH